jgi:hypothetical protein
MTAQAYHTDDDQLVQQHEQAAPENNLMEPDAHLTEPDTGLAVAEVPPAEPDTGLAWTPVPPAEPDTGLAVAEVPPAEPETDLAEAEVPPAEPDADQTGHEDPTSHAADDAAMAGYDSAAAVSDYPGFTADGDDGPQEPGIADSNAGSPSPVSAAVTAPDSPAESHLAGNGARAHGPWSEIQAMFVDDPRASIERAAGLVDERVEALIQSVRERQRSMQSAWRADDAGTEELRVALQHYRSFWNTLADLPAQA